MAGCWSGVGDRRRGAARLPDGGGQGRLGVASAVVSLSVEARGVLTSARLGEPGADHLNQSGPGITHREAADGEVRGRGFGPGPNLGEVRRAADCGGRLQ